MAPRSPTHLSVSFFYLSISFLSSRFFDLCDSSTHISIYSNNYITEESDDEGQPKKPVIPSYLLDANGRIVTPSIANQQVETGNAAINNARRLAQQRERRYADLELKNQVVTELLRRSFYMPEPFIRPVDPNRNRYPIEGIDLDAMLNPIDLQKGQQGKDGVSGGTPEFWRRRVPMPAQYYIDNNLEVPEELKDKGKGTEKEVPGGKQQQHQGSGGGGGQLGLQDAMAISQAYEDDDEDSEDADDVEEEGQDGKIRDKEPPPHGQPQVVMRGPQSQGFMIAPQLQGSMGGPQRSGFMIAPQIQAIRGHSPQIPRDFMSMAGGLMGGPPPPVMMGRGDLWIRPDRRGAPIYPSGDLDEDDQGEEDDDANSDANSQDRRDSEDHHSSDEDVQGEDDSEGQREGEELDIPLRR